MAVKGNIIIKDNQELKTNKSDIKAILYKLLHRHKHKPGQLITWSNYEYKVICYLPVLTIINQKGKLKHCYQLLIQSKTGKLFVIKEYQIN